MEQTAVEWLVEKLTPMNWTKEYMQEYYKDAINKAKEMEKQQIIDAHIDGFYSPPFRKSRNGEAKDYYNKLKE